MYLCVVHDNEVIVMTITHFNPPPHYLSTSSSPIPISHLSFPHLSLLHPCSTLLPSAGTNKDLLQMQEDHFRKEGRYQENEENLAMFAIKERYIQYHKFMPCTQLAIHNVPTVLYTGLWKWWSSFSTFDSTFDSRYPEPSPVSGSHVPTFHHLQYQKLGT